MLFATVPAAPPTRKNQRTTSCPAPISAKVPYQRGSRLILSALEWVSIIALLSPSRIRALELSPEKFNLPARVRPIFSRHCFGLFLEAANLWHLSVFRWVTGND